jgi:hypothetical protein
VKITMDMHLCTIIGKIADLTLDTFSYLHSSRMKGYQGRDAHLTSFKMISLHIGHVSDVLVTIH